MDQIKISGNLGFKFTSQVKQRCGSPTVREGMTLAVMPSSRSGYRNITVDSGREFVLPIICEEYLTDALDESQQLNHKE